MKGTTNVVQDTFPSSTAVITKIQAKSIKGIGFHTKYPWKTIQIGHSFIVDPNVMKLSTLIPYANRVGRKLGKKFEVFDHGDNLEVARYG